MDREVTPTLRMPAGTDVAGYKSALLVRFANPALRHRTWQIAMDGTQKLPQRLLATIRERLRAGQPFDRSEEHTSELQSLMRISYAVFCLKKKKRTQNELM